MKPFASVRGRAVDAAVALIFIFPLPMFSGVEVPIKHVVIYKHGLAFFERNGSVPAGEEVELDFKTSEMNDVLKSFTVSDTSGARVTDVRYDAKEPLDQQLAKYPFRLGDGELVTAFLGRLKGSQIQLKNGDQSIVGDIMIARAITTGEDKKLVREQLTLLLQTGEIATLDLGSIASFRLTDSRLQDHLKQYLKTLARGKAIDRRSIYVNFGGAGRRDLRISYVTPAAIWKSSYRLNLNGSSSGLEGWAIVDNTTGQDWTDVQLSVVSGRPISFVSLLDVPRYGNRQVAELPEDRAAGPVVYGGAMDSVQQAGRAGNIGGVLGGVPKAKPLAPQSVPRKAQGDEEMAAEAANQAVTVTSSVAAASGELLGELFEYKFSTPVTVKKNESAMLPFLQEKINARKLLIYNDTSGEHPVNAAEIVNSSAKTLDGGPITIYDGGAYAGEALFETLKAGDKRLIGYAVDYGTRITTRFGSGSQNVREVHLQEGTLRVKYSTLETRTYAIKNVDAKPKTLIVEQPAAELYTLVSPKPNERAAQAYRFEVQLAGNQSEEFKVQQEHISFAETEVSNAAPDFLLALIANKELDENARRQLRRISELKQKLVEVNAGMAAIKAQSEDLSADQNRLRQNIDSLNRVKGEEEQVRRYSGQLGVNEVELSKLRDQIGERAQRRAGLETSLRELIGGLSF